MTESSKIDRSRRNLLMAATLAGGALVAVAAPLGVAVAQGRPRGGGGHNGGGPDHHGGPGHGDDNHSCFRRGTLILTTEGYRPVETLKVGELLQTHFSGAVRIEDVPNFTIARSGVDHAWPEQARPVLVKRGALGDNLPTADLCLTASHALFKNGFLIPVGDLVNDDSIVFESADGWDVLQFFHIELARHDVIYANGALCESLRFAAVEPCVPVLSFNGNWSQLTSRLRSAASVILDRRQPLDIIRDELEERASSRARAA